MKPNVTSWRSITLGNAFTVCKNLTTNGNSLENTNNIDSHLIKNIEWGAVAYLSKSVYGKNSAVWNNPYNNNYSTITGLCGNSQNASQTILTNTYKYNEAGGENASTTGNVYGIYDMAGGLWELVAGYIDKTLNNNTTLRSYSQSLYDTDDKYKDKYEEILSADKYGDAMYETSGWDSDFNSYLDNSAPVLFRGSHSFSGASAGIFAYGKGTGNIYAPGGFRPCIVIN